MNERTVDVEVCIGHPRWLCRWWLSFRPCVSEQIDGLWTAPSEGYIPWWAWPFELCHRLIWGRCSLSEEEHETNNEPS